ncbi:glycosyltransferase family 4 protein [bacterium]|nr:glycosyltransferase family 4 protein [bacterium]
MGVGRKKILFVHHGSGMGGAPQLLLELLKRLDKEKYDPVIWCIRKSSASDLFQKSGYRVVVDERAIPFLHISDGFYGIRKPHLVFRMTKGQFTSYRTAKRIFAEEKPDLIHINTIVVPGILKAAHGYGCPVVVNVLEVLSRGYTGFRRMLIRHFTKRWGNAFVFMLPSEHKRWRIRESVPTCDVFDFIDVPAYQTVEPDFNFRSSLTGGDPKKILVGYFGRFTRAKGVHKLLRSAALLKKEGLNFHLALVGPVETEKQYPFWRKFFGLMSWSDRLRRMIDKMGLWDTVTFCGPSTNVMPLVTACDILAVPFQEPHFSRLIAEASSAGKPSVAFNIDGPGEEIVPEETGLTVPPFDHVKFASALERLARDEKLRVSCGEKAAKFAAEEFDAESNARKVFALYTALGL